MTDRQPRTEYSQTVVTDARLRLNNRKTVTPMKMNVGTKIGLGYAFAVFLILALSAAAFLSTVKRARNADWVMHTYEVRSAARGLLVQLLDAETGQRGYLYTAKDDYLEPYNLAAQELGDASKELRALVSDDPAQLRRLDELDLLVTTKLAELKQTIDLVRSNDVDGARQVVMGDLGKQTMDDIRQLISDFREQEDDLLEARHAAEATASMTTKLVVSLGSLLAVIMLALVGVRITRNVTTPLRDITEAAEEISRGNLAVDLPATDREDELGLLARTFLGMVTSLRDQTREINEGVGSLVSSACEISSLTSQLASSTAETATAIAQSTTTAEEVKQTARVASQKAHAVADSSQKAMQAGQAGARAVDATTTTMNRIQEQMDSVAQSIMRLSEQTQAIGEIAATVSDLADQSNLLAVNASIEAAHAGEHGKGFAVVAQEIQNLAGQSKRATVQVRTILGDIQKATNGTVMSIEQGNKAVESGVQQAAQAGEAIRTLAGSMTEAAQAAAQIAASSQQQTTGMDQVALAMESIKEAGIQAADSTRQAETAAHSLQELGMRLKKLVERYKG